MTKVKNNTENGSQGDCILKNNKVAIVKVRKEDIKLYEFGYAKNGFLSIRTICEGSDLKRLFLKFILKCFGNEYEIIDEEYNDKYGVTYFHTNLPVDKLDFESPSKEVDVLVCAEDIKLIGYEYRCNYKGNLSILCNWYTQQSEEIILNAILKCFGKEYHIDRGDFDENETSEVWYHTNLPYQKFITLNNSGKIMKIETKQEDIITLGVPLSGKTGNTEMDCYNIIEVFLLRSILHCFGEEYKIDSIHGMYDCTTNLPYNKVDVMFPSPMNIKE